MHTETNGGHLWTILITLFDKHQVHVKRVVVTICHLNMWTSFLVSVAAHLTSQIIEYHLHSPAFELNIMC